MSVARITVDEWRRPEALDAFDLATAPEADREMLTETIPDPIHAEMYVPRIVRGTPDVDILAAAMDARMNVLLTGPTGVAKTTMLRAFAARWGLPYVRVPVSGNIDIDAVFGRWNPTEDGKLTYMQKPIVAAWRSGGVVLTDEINMASGNTTARLHEMGDVERQITLERYDGTVVRAHDALLFGATRNEGGEYHGTRPMNAALVGRYSLHINLDYDVEVETEVVGVPALVDVAHAVRGSDLVRTAIGTNRLLEFKDNYRMLGWEFAYGMFLETFPAAERGGVERAFMGFEDAVAADLEAAIAAEDDDA